MCNRVVRAVLGLSVAVALASGPALAKVSKDQNKPAKSKTIAQQPNKKSRAIGQAGSKKNHPSSKDAAVHHPRIKKIGNTAAKQTANAIKPAKTAKQNSRSQGVASENSKTKEVKVASVPSPSATKERQPEGKKDQQLASNNDSSSTTQRHTHIHIMRVPE